MKKVIPLLLLSVLIHLLACDIYSQSDKTKKKPTPIIDSTAIINDMNLRVSQSTVSGFSEEVNTSISLMAVVTPTYYVKAKNPGDLPQPVDGSFEHPFTKIQQAIDAAVAGNTIQVLPGIYYENIDYKGKNIKIYGSPENPYLTVINGGGITHCVQMINAVNSTAILNGFTLTNGKAISTATYHTSKGGGIYLFDNANPTLANLIITGNAASTGGGFAALHSASPTLENVLMYNNTAGAGGVIYIYNGAHPSFTNVSIIKNSTTNLNHGAIYLSRNATPTLRNSIVWNPESAYEISFNSSSSSNGPCNITFNYSDKRGGQLGYVNKGTSGYTMTVTWGTGCISSDPAFVNYMNYQYTLANNSPCIDAGDPSQAYYDVQFPPSKGTTRNDMGAFGGPSASVWAPGDPIDISANAGILINNSIKLDWSDEWNLWNNEIAIEVERSTDNINFARIANLIPNSTKYFDINLKPDVTYYYRIRAIADNGTGTPYINSNSVYISKIVKYLSGTNTKNFSETTGYGENGTVIQQTIAFYDNLGKSTQAISRNIANGRVMASQTYYDNLGRPLLNSLAVPVSQTNLNYITALAKTGTTDLETITLNENSVKDLAISSTSPLGKYYSTSSIESYTPEDFYPYTAVQYSKSQPGVIRKTTLAGKYHRLGANHESQSYQMPVNRKELEFLSTVDPDIELEGLVKNITMDMDGKEAISYYTNDARLISSCISNSPKSEDIKVILFSIDTELNNYYYDIHIPKGCDNTLKIYSFNGSNYKFSIIDLSSDNIYLNETTIGSSSTNNIDIVPGVYRLVFQPVSGSYNVYIGYNINYYQNSLNVYNKAGYLIKTYSPKAVAGPDMHNMVTTYEYNSLGQLIATESPDEGRTEFKYSKDGKIRLSQNAFQRSNETSGQGYFSYTDYDALGRVVSVGEFASYTTPFALLNGDETLTGSPQNVTTTVYDNKETPISGYTQNFVTGNVSKTSNANCTTWYSYTYDGRIEWVIQQYNGMAGVKTIDYEYDFNGYMVRSIYQKNGILVNNIPNYEERFDHENIYDADGKLSMVLTKDYTSDGKINKQKLQVRYIYYAHGPLKRIELGDNLQGVDYIYTINSWLKSINNPNMINTDFDPGGDGSAGSLFGQDVFAMSLDYFNDDFKRTGKNIISSADPGTGSYGGLIYAQRWNSNQMDRNIPVSPTQNMYKYEYTNESWLGKATFGNFNSTFTPSQGSPYKVYGLNGSIETNIQYDANGNILNMAQNGSSFRGFDMDKLTYNYIDGKNQLNFITDLIQTDNYDEDISTQNSGNYTYNSIGQLTGIKDLQYFDYDVYGHVTKIWKNSLKTIPLAEYVYDEKGFRIKKIDYSATPETITWYVRDASGNILAIYSGTTPVRSELEIYGLTRLGTARVVNTTIDKYFYELTDHLGNVRALVTEDGTDQNEMADLASYTDYYPFGMEMPDMKYRSGLLPSSRFGYQGQFAEKDPETGYNQFEARLYDSRIGRWMIPDPLGVNWSPYLAMGNNPLKMVDPDGREELPKNFIGPPNIDDWYATDRWQNNEWFKFASKNFFESNKSSIHINEFWFKLALYTFFQNNPSRPDADMFLTFDEATYWSNKGEGKPLFVDARKINLKPLKVPDVIEAKYKNSGYYDFFDDMKGDYNTGRVYGNLKITLLDPYKGIVKLGVGGNLLDIHDFKAGPAKLIDDFWYKGEAENYNIYCLPCISKVPYR